MRKQTKVVAVASAAALLAIGGAMTSFAAQGWVEEDGTWYYYDKDGNRVEDEWKKSGDNWFWLDSEEGGAMATDKLIDDDNCRTAADDSNLLASYAALSLQSRKDLVVSLACCCQLGLTDVQSILIVVSHTLIATVMRADGTGDERKRVAL